MKLVFFLLLFVQALKAADSVFGSKVNSKGFLVLKGAGVIQGDGMSAESIHDVLKRVKNEGYSAENCAFGMGGGLLQKINRDTLSFATKLSHIVYEDGASKDIMKTPKTDSTKFSLPGKLAVKSVNGFPTAFPFEFVLPEDNLLHVLYDQRPLDVKWESFSEIRKRVKREWSILSENKAYNPISVELRTKIESFITENAPSVQ